MHARIAFILAALAVILMVLKPWKDSSSTPTPLPPQKEVSKPTSQTIEKIPPPEHSKAPEPSPLAKELHTPNSSVTRDLEIIQTLLNDYRLITKHGNPSGTNQEITSALTGNNRFNIAPLPRDHKNISIKGELLDRFGSPYTFHNLSAEHIEIRSAGPDKKTRTADDTLHSNLPKNSKIRL